MIGMQNKSCRCTYRMTQKKAEKPHSVDKLLSFIEPHMYIPSVMHYSFTALMCQATTNLAELVLQGE